jgi:hypothetical protein
MSPPQLVVCGDQPAVEASRQTSKWMRSGYHRSRTQMCCKKHLFPTTTNCVGDQLAVGDNVDKDINFETFL